MDVLGDIGHSIDPFLAQVNSIDLSLCRLLLSIFAKTNRSRLKSCGPLGRYIGFIARILIHQPSDLQGRPMAMQKFERNSRPGVIDPFYRFSAIS